MHSGEREKRMRTATWAVFGSLLINSMLALGIAAVFSASPSARAAAATHCASHAGAAPARHPPAPPSPTAHRYIVAVRMGWAI